MASEESSTSPEKITLSFDLSRDTEATPRKSSARRLEEAARARNPLRPPGTNVADICTESLTNPSTSRLLLAALGFPVDYFVSNVEPELQAELAGDEVTAAGQREKTDEDPLKAPWVAAVKAMSALRDARALHSSSTTAARRVYAEKLVVESLFVLQETAAQEGRLMASCRGEAGETIAHMACLLRLYDVVMLLLDMEPMLIAEGYTGTQYRGETLLHMLCAGGQLVQLRRFAQRALFPRDEIVACEVIDRQHSRTTAAHRAAAWHMLWKWEKEEASRHALRRAQKIESPSAKFSLKTDVGTGPDSDWNRAYYGVRAGHLFPATPSSLGPDPGWCRAWLRAAWITIVNSLCTGTFFQPQPEGTCDYGGTALSFAVVMSYVDIVRFLVVEVGCTVPALWAEVAQHEALQISKTTFADVVDQFDDPLYEQNAASARDIGIDLVVQGLADPDDGADNTFAADLRVEVEEERLIMFPGCVGCVPVTIIFACRYDRLSCRALGLAELLIHWDPSICARIDMQDEYGNTAGHLAVMHYGNANMFTFLAGLYQNGFGRCDTVALYAAPHAQLARAVMLLPSVSVRHEELMRFSASPGLQPLSRSASAIDVLEQPGAADVPGAAPAFSLSSTVENDVSPSQPEVVPPIDETHADKSHHRSRPHPHLAPLRTSSVRPKPAPVLPPAGPPNSSRGKISVSPASSSLFPTFSRHTLSRDGGTVVSCPYFASLDRVNVRRPEVFAGGSPQSLAFAKGQNLSVAWNPTVVAETIVDFLSSQQMQPVWHLRTPSGMLGSTHSTEVPTVWSDLQKTVLQRLQALTHASDEDQVASRQAAAGLAFIETYDSELRRVAQTARPQLIDLTNHEGLTPFTLGGREGKRAIVESLWNSNSKLVWTWGGVTARTFALDQVDDIGQLADKHPDIVQTVSVLQGKMKNVGPGDSLAAMMCCCDQYFRDAARGCFLGRGRTMRMAACCCGPRLLYRIPPRTTDSQASPNVSSLLYNAWAVASLPLRFLFRRSPVPEAPSPSVLCNSSPTLLQEVVQGGHWHLLEPSETASGTSTPADVLKSAALAATVSVHGMASFNATQVTTGRPAYLPHDKEATQDLYRRFRTKARDLAVHESVFDEHEDGECAEDEFEQRRSTLSGASAEQEDPGRQLLQLVQRKWNRIYAVQFYRLMISRIVFVFFLWGAITVRAGYVSAGTRSDLFCDSPTNTDSQIATIGSCAQVRILILALTIATFIMLSFHVWRFFVLGGQTLWRSITRSGSFRHTRERLFLTHQAASYVAGHSGAFGNFYIVTLILSCGLIFIGGIVDLTQGWTNASPLYAIGSFIAGSHLSYYLLGFGTTGPLVVMLAVALPTFWRYV